MDSHHCSPTDGNGKGERRLFVRVDHSVLPILARIGPMAGSVYLALKSYADRNGQCYPKHDDVAQRCGVSVRTVKRILPLFAAAGLITFTTRSTNSGRLSNLYQLVDSQSATEALSGIGKVPHRHPQSATQAPAKCHSGTPSRTTEVEPLNKNHIFPALLSEIIGSWNALGSSIGPPIRNPLKPPKALVDVFRRLEHDLELREAFSDLPAIMGAIRKATYCHGQGWFSLPWIFTRDPHTRELRVHKLLNGAYDSNGDTRKQQRGGPGQKYDPDCQQFGHGLID